MSTRTTRPGQGLIEYLLLALPVLLIIGMLLIGPFVGLSLLLPDLFGAPSPTLVKIAGALLLVAAATTLLSTLLTRRLRDRVPQRAGDDTPAKAGSFTPLSLFTTLLRFTVGLQLFTRGSAEPFGSLESTLIGAYLLYPLVTIPVDLLRRRFGRGGSDSSK